VKIFVTLKIYNVLGHEISTMISQNMNPGIYKINWDASNYPSGIYFYKIETLDFSKAMKMILIK
jgi:hypothetical protein